MADTPDFIPDSQFVPDNSQGQPSPAVQPGRSPDFIPDNQFTSDEDKYGTVEQQIKTGLEGGAQGLIGAFAPYIETKLGVNPADIRHRAETNPWVHGLSEAGTFGASMFTGVGEAALLGKAGEGAVAASKALGLGEGVAGKIGQEAVRGAFETALMQGGDQLTNAVLQDPGQHAEFSLADVGLAAALGGGLGGIGSAIGQAYNKSKSVIGSKFVSELDKPAIEAGDFAANVKHSGIVSEAEHESFLDALKKQKPEAPEIREAAARLGAPVMEGMTADHPVVQRAEDLLLNSVPTYSGIQRQGMYREGYQKALGAVDEALGSGSEHSKAELGNIFKNTLTKQIEDQVAPISDLYNEIKQVHSIIPLSEKSAPAIAKNISEIKELSLSPSSPEGQLAKRVMGEIGNLKTVDDVKTYKSILNRSISPTASSGEKRMASILSDKLSDLEENSIIRFAKENVKTPLDQERVLNVINQRKLANGQYKELMDKVGTLSERLGKGRVHGPQDAINFIRERLTPEEITQKLFSKNDSEFLSFFGKEFPGEMALMRDYQKGVLREGASLNGEFRPNSLFKNVNKLEPEIQKAIFNPTELQKLKDAQTYLQSFPKASNPSGTAHTNAFIEFAQHPTGAAIANARDLALQKFIKMAGSSPEMNMAMRLAKATVNGVNKAEKAATALFGPGKSLAIADIIGAKGSDEKNRDKLQSQLDDLRQNPEKIVNNISNTSAIIPEYSTAYGRVAGAAANYLNNIKPRPTKVNPLDAERPPTKAETHAYNRSLDMVNHPLNVVAHIKSGTLLPSDVAAIKSVYPGWYSGMSQKLMSAMVDHVKDGGTVPYTTRQSLSLFLGFPLDSTMTQQAVQSIQMTFAQNRPQPQAQPQRGTQVGMAKLGKMSQGMQTLDQGRTSRLNKS